MAVVEITGLRSDTYFTRWVNPKTKKPEMIRLDVTPEKQKRWARIANEMIASGIKIPVCWGHQKKGVPRTQEELAKRQRNLAYYNAGHLLSVRYDPDEEGMIFRMDVPGCQSDEKGNLIHEAVLPDGTKVMGSVSEVSVALKEFRDGSNKKWPEAIIHVALTPLPVMRNQDGFRRARDVKRNKTFYMSHDMGDTIYYLGGDNDADDGKGGDDSLGKAVDFLKKKFGLNMPPTTTPDELVTNLAMASHYLAAGGDPPLGTKKGGDELDDLDLDDLDDEEDEDQEDEDLDEEKDTAREEQRAPMTMSTATMDRATKVLLLKTQQNARENRIQRVKRIFKKGYPKKKAQTLLEEARGYELSLAEDGTEIETGFDIRLSAIEDALDLGGNVSAGKKSRGKFKIAKRPHHGRVPDSENPDLQAKINEAAARHSRVS